MKKINVTQKGLEILEEKEVHLDTKKISDKWMSKYVLAKKYYEHYGNLEIPFRFKTKNGINYDENGIKLGTWIYTQRQSFKGKGGLKVTSEQIRLLEEIGIQWEIIDREEQWMYKYDLAKEYYGYYGDLEIPQKFKTKNGIDYHEDGINLRQWIDTQRKVLEGKKSGRITSEQIKLLKEIGIDSIGREKQWMINYELAKKYYEHYGNLEIPRTFRTINGTEYDKEGVNLGEWIYTKRQSFKGKGNGKITLEQIKLLEEIGMKWFTDNIDNKLQSKIINEGNIKSKKRELENRFYSVLNSYDDEELPTKEELNNKVLCKLNTRK